MGAAPLWRAGAPTRRPTHRPSPVCVCPPPLPCDGHVFASRAAGGHPLPPPWRPLATPGAPAASCTTGTVTCVAPNALSTVCPPLPVRSCWRVRGHRPTLALADGAYRLSRAKSRTLSLKLTVPYIYFFYDTMLTISEHLCVGLMVSL